MTPSFTLKDVAASVAHRRRALLLTTLAVALGAAALLFLLPPWYTARVALVPEGRGGANAGQLAGLAALAGISLPAGGGGPVGQTPQFYVALLKSRPIVYAVLNRRYAVTASANDSASLVDILDPAGATAEQRLWNAARRLGKDVSVDADIRTGIVTLTYEHSAPTLAAAVAMAFVQELERFNRVTRQSQAGARRRFTEARVAEASRDLQAAEDSLRTFLTHNRQFAGSPGLQFEHGRLQRALSVQQELYLQLRRELDAARIAEVDDLPAITIVEPPIVPQRKSGPARRQWFAAAVVLALIIQTGWYVLADHHASLVPNLAPTLRVLAPRLAQRLNKTPRNAA